jgi:hypothetical protein
MCPHSELIVCDKYREQRTLYIILSVSSAFSQHSEVNRCATTLEKHLTEDEISTELLADRLSDVPNDADSDSDSSVIGNRKNKIVHPLPSYSDSEQSANTNVMRTMKNEIRRFPHG